jgi:hypothetical protein
MKDTKTMTKLDLIAKKFGEIKHNANNYYLGGGLDGFKFASRRHEAARRDLGKLTLGEATILFKKATGRTTDQVKAVIKYAVPSMEWHHAGKLPARYGGGMKRTYFVNSTEITDIAKHFEYYLSKI